MYGEEESSDYVYRGGSNTGYIPSPPAALTAAASLGPETVRIGAPTIKGREAHGNHDSRRAAEAVDTIVRW